MTLGISDEEFENAIDAASGPQRIDLARAKDFTVGPIEITPCLRQIKGPDGECVIEPKVMQVLIALGEETGTILSRDDLIERCWEGRVVGESSINRVISLLRAGLKSVGGESVIVENVPKVGYRLMVSPEWEASHTEAAAVPPQPANDAGETEDAQSQRPGLLVLAGGLAALVAIIIAVLNLWPATPSTPVERIKVAMLPIKTSDSVDPLYARGLEEELRTQLARVGRMEVTSSESARQLFEKGLSADEICRKLGADFAWVGSLDVEDDRVTLSARLIEAGTKEDAFSESLSSSPDSAQTLPLRTARAITTALGRPVSERLPQTPVASSDFQLYLTALGLIRTRGDEQRVAALEILQQVTQRNPDFADGWAGLAKAWFLLPSEDKAEIMANRERAGEFAEQALSLDPDSVDAIKVMGMLESTEPNRRLALLKRATQLDPGDPEAWYWRGITQREFLLEAENPVVSASRVVSIDPLWPASWRASELAAQFGQLEQAFAIEDAISSAAITPSQNLLSQARRAQLEGDFSRFVELTREARATQTPAERLFGAKTQEYAVFELLDLPSEGTSLLPAGFRPCPKDCLAERSLPPRRELERDGLSGASFWTKPKFAELSLPLFLAEGRAGELVENYDAGFANHAEFLEYASANGEAHRIIPSVSPYLALALQSVGREDEAAQHIASVEEQVERWRAAQTGVFDALIYELNLAALQGDEARAIALIQRLPEFGWPYSMGHIKPTTTSLLREDPLYADLQDLPEVQAVLAPVRATLEREREEVLALGI